VHTAGAALLLTVRLMVSQGFPDRAGRFDRLGLLDGLSLFDGLGLPDFFGDHFFLFDAEPVINPAAHILDECGKPLNGRQPRGPHRAALPHGAKILHRWRGGFFLPPSSGDETEFSQVIAQGLQFNGSFAFVRIGNAACEQIGVIRKDMDALTTTGNADVKLFTVHGPE
jgi:hypothetical protein